MVVGVFALARVSMLLSARYYFTAHDAAALGSAQALNLRRSAARFSREPQASIASLKPACEPQASIFSSLKTAHPGQTLFEHGTCRQLLRCGVRSLVAAAAPCCLSYVANPPSIGQPACRLRWLAAGAGWLLLLLSLMLSRLPLLRFSRPRKVLTSFEILQSPSYLPVQKSKISNPSLRRQIPPKPLLHVLPQSRLIPVQPYPAADSTSTSPNPPQ